MNERENVALFDLDGTLADYDGQMIRDLNALKAPSEQFLTHLDHSGLPDHIEARRRLIKNQPGWWKNLPLTDHGMLMWQLAVDAGFDPHILTQGPLHSPDAWTEKLLWVQEKLFEGEDAQITITRKKGLVYGKVLFDDYVEYIEAWLKWRPRGLVIMPAHHHNAYFSHPNVIRFDGSDEIIEKTKNALEKAMER